MNSTRVIKMFELRVIIFKNGFIKILKCSTYYLFIKIFFKFVFQKYGLSPFTLNYNNNIK